MFNSLSLCLVYWQMLTLTNKQELFICLGQRNIQNAVTDASKLTSDLSNNSPTIVKSERRGEGGGEGRCGAIEQPDTLLRTRTKLYSNYLTSVNCYYSTTLDSSESNQVLECRDTLKRIKCSTWVPPPFSSSTQH